MFSVASMSIVTYIFHVIYFCAWCGINGKGWGLQLVGVEE